MLQFGYYCKDTNKGLEILKMLFLELIMFDFDEPTAVLTPQEIDELMMIMKDLAKEGKSIVFIYIN